MLCYCEAPATTGALCTEHLATLTRNLERAPGVLRDLDVTITGQAAQGGGGNGSGTPDVFNEKASDVRVTLEYLLRAAARTANPRLRTTTPAQHAAAAIDGVHVIARSPGAHTTAQDLADALTDADRVRDRAEEKIAYGACECGTQLVAPKSRDTARCRNPDCAAVWDVHQLRAYQHVAALDRVHEYVGTTTDVVRVLNTAGHDVNHSTVRSWLRRGSLVYVEGRKIRAADVLELRQTA